MPDQGESLRESLRSWSLAGAAPRRRPFGGAFHVLLQPSEWPTLARRFCALALRCLWWVANFIYENFSSFVARCLWALAGLIIATIAYNGLTQHVTVIETISVPKTLVDRGYSQDVAAQRFRDALTRFAKSTNTRMRQSDVALHAELPNIVVPTVGISLDAVMSSMRSLLRSTRSQSLSGEFTIIHDQLWLRLRLNGIEIYNNTQGGDPEKPDDLLAAAAPEAMKKIQPYLVAVSLSDKQPDAALDLIKWITSSLPQDDENVAWAYNLKGSILTQRKEFEAAEEALSRALELNGKLAAPHINLGNIRRTAGRRVEALAEFKEAIRLDPGYWIAHNQLGLVLEDSGRSNEAVLEYREAIRLKPDDPLPRNNLGIALRAMGRREEAIAEYREAIRVDPSYSNAHYNLAIALAAGGDFLGSVDEGKEAIRLNPNNARAHNNLANSLLELNRNDEAVSEYREAVRLDPKNVPMRLRLARALDMVGRENDAIVEFQAIIQMSPDNEIARDYLKDHSSTQSKSN